MKDPRTIGDDEGPLISIITPCLNRAEFIADAIESVLVQGYGNFEHVIIDGGSTDGTLDILSRYDHLRVISEPDDGLYEAINKGITLSRGALIGHLNSDDIYLPGAFRSAVDAFRTDPKPDSVAGGAEVVKYSPEGERYLRAFDEDEHRFLDLRTITRGVPIINARFFDRALYERVGLYDTSFKIAADRDFLIRTWLSGMTTRGIPGVVYRYRQHGGSLTIGGVAPTRGQREAIELAEKWLKRAPTDAVRFECTRWWSRENGRLIGTLCREGRWRSAWQQLVHSMGARPLWPLRFIAIKMAEKLRWELRKRRGVRNLQDRRT